MMTYREQFKPSATRDKPLAILALHVVCADTDADAERLATSVDLNFALRRQGSTSRSRARRKPRRTAIRRPTAR